jgi:hypothetical protein
LQKRRRNIKAFEALLWLDYGTIYDSAGGHVDIWSATITTVEGGEEKTQHVDIYYDKKGDDTGNKNSLTGQLALRELLDPAYNDHDQANGRSLLLQLAPKTTHLIISGDTGNGFRGIPMSLYHSSLKRLYGLTVEQIPLPPRHAHNPTDQHLAHLNMFFRKRSPPF